MYQMTLFKKKVIYKRLLFNYTHQKMLNCTIFSQFSWGSMSPNPPRKGHGPHGFTIKWLCAAYCFDTCKFTFQKINLGPL